MIFFTQKMSINFKLVHCSFPFLCILLILGKYHEFWVISLGYKNISVNFLFQLITVYQRRSKIRIDSAAYFCIIGFLVNILCIVAPPVGTRSWRVKFVFFYVTSYVGSTSHQHLATVIRYADSVNSVKQPFRPSRRRLVANFTSLITRLIRL